MEQKREIRSYQGGLYQPRLREAGEGVESRMIEGYAIVFNEQSQLLADWYQGPYREIIHPEAIDMEKLNASDIKMTLWHNREKLIARSCKGSGTLKLSVDERGVKYEFEAPRTPDGETALELVRRGDLAGSSFTYWSDENTSVRYEKDEEGVLLRHVNSIDNIYEMTIASDPAYQQTSVSAREVESHGVVLHEQTEEQKREAAAAHDAAVRMDIDTIESIINNQ